jgi:hypothetical protein
MLMTEITRRSRLRALKAYGLRCLGLTYTEIGWRISRVSPPNDKRLLTRETARMITLKGETIVGRWHLVRFRKLPRYIKFVTKWSSVNHG